jgi:glycosyltransferase involved in cell wall biosynthesis
LIDRFDVTVSSHRTDFRQGEFPIGISIPILASDYSHEGDPHTPAARGRHVGGAFTGATVSPQNPRPIRVLHVLNTLDTGGAEAVVLNLARACDRTRFDLRVVSLGQDGPIGQQLRAADVPTFALGRRPGIDPGLALKVARLCRTHAIDVVHSHNVAPWLYAGPSARLVGAAVCHTEHSNLAPGQRALWHAERWLAQLTRVVICDGDSVRRQLIEQQGLPARKVITIHNGIDLARFGRPADRAATRRAAGITGDGPIIGTVARLEAVKDQALLIRAFAKVLPAQPTARLCIVGGGSLRSALQAQVMAAGLGDAVVFLGHRDDVADLLPLFDLFALSSISEGLPLTLIEAMAAGLPCVATDVGAVADAVAAGHSGLLVPARDEVGFSAALLQLLLDRDRARRMGENGQHRARAHFDLRMMVKRYEDLWAA